MPRFRLSRSGGVLFVSNTGRQCIGELSAKKSAFSLTGPRNPKRCCRIVLPHPSQGPRKPERRMCPSRSPPRKTPEERRQNYGVFENTENGATRMQGFWATHPQLAQLAWLGGTGYGHSFPGVAAIPGGCAKRRVAPPGRAAGPSVFPRAGIALVEMPNRPIVRGSDMRARVNKSVSVAVTVRPIAAEAESTARMQVRNGRSFPLQSSADILQIVRCSLIDADDINVR
jgi:hypothetical protein